MITAVFKRHLINLAFLMPILFGLSFSLSADEFRPALLEVTEREGGWIEVTWKVPMLGEKVLAISPVFPEFFEPFGPGSSRLVPGAMIESKSFSTGGQALHGATLHVKACGTSDRPEDDLAIAVRNQAMRAEGKGSGKTTKGWGSR